MQSHPAWAVAGCNCAIAVTRAVGASPQVHGRCSYAAHALSCDVTPVAASHGSGGRTHSRVIWL